VSQLAHQSLLASIDIRVTAGASPGYQAGDVLKRVVEDRARGDKGPLVNESAVLVAHGLQAVANIYINLFVSVG
jgi:hypothetical protein